MDVNTKSKFRRGQIALSENEINDLLNVVKESAEAVAEAAKEVPQAEIPTPKVEPVKVASSRKFYAIEKNKTTGKYDVVEAIEQDGVIKRSQVIESHTSVAVSIAKLNEAISRLCLIKKDF